MQHPTGRRLNGPPCRVNLDRQETFKMADLGDQLSTQNAAEDAEASNETQEFVIEGETEEGGEYYVVVEEGNVGTDLGDGVQLVEVDDSDGSGTLVLDQGRGGRLQPKQQPAQRYTVPQQQIRSRTAIAGTQQGRTVIAQTEDGTFQLVQLVEEGDDESGDCRTQMDDTDPLSVGAMATAVSGDEGLVQILEPIPQGLKGRRHRVFGTCRCPECGQSFVNTARLERHLAVHQVFGSYLCPLCGKTYKYEYNLFYHWRKTCRDLNELMGLEERKSMDVNGLRQLVDEVAAKKAELGADARRLPPVEITPEQQIRTEIPAARRGEPCPECGVVVMGAHLDRHIQIHKGEAAVDARSAAGGFYCDLCGLMFRAHFNLIKHWRTSCPEIQVQLNPDVEITMDDGMLKQLVQDLLQKKKAEGTSSAKRASAELIDEKDVAPVAPEMEAQGAEDDTMEPPPTLDAEVGETEPINPARLVKGRSRQDEDVDVTTVEERRRLEAPARLVAQQTWTQDTDSFLDDELMDAADEYAALMQQPELGPLGLPTPLNRAKWSSLGGPVQCPECFRSFANAGRLERHLTGFHQSYGTHHCILCGNRFKYDYNLLYHYRHSCPYTKAFIDRDVREQMDAGSLRKLVKSLAQKEVRLAPQVQPPPKLPGRREPPRPRLAMRYPSNQPPAHLLLPRPGMPEGKTCPVCGVIFYGTGSIKRHIQATHADEYENWENAGGEEATGMEQVQMVHMEGEEMGPELEQIEERISPPPTSSEAPLEQPKEQDIESSIATILTEMKGEPEPKRRGRPAKRGRSPKDGQQQPIVQQVLIDDADFEDAVQINAVQLNELEQSGAVVYSAEFEEELDVTHFADVPDIVQPRKKVVTFKDEKQTPQPQPKAQVKKESPFKSPKTSSDSPQCGECGKRFITNAHLTRHMRTHFPPPSDPISCPLCDVSFRQQPHLLSHWRTATCARVKQMVANKKQLKLLTDDELTELVEKIKGAEEEEEEEIEEPEPPVSKRTRRSKARY